jgi:hypothetical protein
MLTIVISLATSFFTAAGGDNIICCHTAADGNSVCSLPSADGCESGDKAVVCRYGVWSDPESGVAECVPN